MPENLSAAQHRALVENINLAMALGATVVYRESEDVAGAILDLRPVREGEGPRSGAPHRRGLLGRVAPGDRARVLEDGGGIDVLVADWGTRVRREAPP